MGSGKRRSSILMRNRKGVTLLHQLVPFLRACWLLYLLLRLGVCPNPSTCTHAAPHVPSLYCHPCQSLASKERGECVCRDLSTERERMGKSIRETELKSLSSPLLQITRSSLSLAHSLIQPATLLNEDVCHISSVPSPSCSLPPLLFLSVSIRLLLTLQPSPTHAPLPYVFLFVQL